MPVPKSDHSSDTLTPEQRSERMGRIRNLPLPTDARTTSVRLLSIIRCWHAVENTFLVELDEFMGSAYYTAAKAFRAMLIDQGDDGLHAVRFWVQSLTDTLLHEDPYLSLAPFRPKLNS